MGAFISPPPPPIVSGEIDLVASGRHVFAHGLGVCPTSCEVWLKCVAGEYGYEIGDEVKFDVNLWPTYYGSMCFKNNSSVSVQFINNPVIITKTDPRQVLFLTLAKWKMVFVVFK